MQQIGRYQIKEEIGRGGMSTVYEAFDPRFKRSVAVKIMTSDLLQDPKLRTRFEREAQTIAALEHPAIVPVYDFGEEDKRPYLVMRLMTGGTLRQRLARGPLSIADSAQILKRIGSALERAHQEGVIHRDLKPSNIMFDQYDDAFLADFGIARLTEGAVNLTGENVIGTPAYMSPEQIHGDQTIDGRSDIYALGVITFEMLTGRRPFDNGTPAKIMMQHLIDPVPDIRQVRPDLPPGVEEVISRSMAKSPDQRYHDTKELTDTLDSLAAITPPASAPQAPEEGEQEEAAHVETPPLGIDAAADIDRTVPDSSEERAPQPVPEPLPAPPAGAVALEKETRGKGDGRRRWIIAAALAALALIIILAGIFLFADGFTTAPEAPVAEQDQALGQEAPAGQDQEADDSGEAPQEQGPSGEEEAPVDQQTMVEGLMDQFYDAMEVEDYGAAEEAILEAIDLAPEEAWLYSEKAWLYDSAGDSDAAIASINEAIALEPQNGAFLATLGTLYRQQGDLEHALQQHREAVELSPGDPFVHMEMAETAYQLANIDLALEHYNRAIELKDDEAWFFDARANLFFEMDDYNQGLADLERAAELEPDNRDFFTEAGDIFLYNHENPERALEFYNRAVEHSPDDPWVYADRANAFSAMGDMDAALRDMNEAIERDPQTVPFYIQRSDLYRYELNDLDAALADLQRAQELEPDNPDVYASRADFFRYSMGDLEAALAEANRAVALEKDAPWRYAERGSIYLEMAREDEALADFNQCLAIDPHYYWCSWEKAWLLDSLDQKQEAVQQLQHFLQNAPQDDCPECHMQAEDYIRENG